MYISLWLNLGKVGYLNPLSHISIPLSSFLLLSYSPGAFLLLTFIFSWFKTNSCKFISFARSREFENFILNQLIKTYRNETPCTESPSSDWYLSIFHVFDASSKIPDQGCSLFKNNGCLMTLQKNNSHSVWQWRYFPPNIWSFQEVSRLLHEEVTP